MAEDTVQLSSSMTRAVCSVCRHVMPVTRAGLIRVHAPVGNRCSSSHLPPAPSGLSLLPAASTSATPPSSLPALPSQNQEPEVFCLFGPPHLVKTVKKIPRTSRNIAARKMAAILQNVISLNDVSTWDRLYHFATRCLRTPKRVAVVEAWPHSSTRQFVMKRTQTYQLPPASANRRTKTPYNF